MKKIFTLVSALFVSCASFSQAIQNPGFENWSIQTLYSDPTGFTSSNLQTFYLGGAPNVTKVGNAQQGSFAARMETTLIDGDTISGSLAIGTPSQFGFDGGTPYTGVPDTVVVYAKYNIMAGDTAFVGVAFKSNGNVVGQALRTVTGSASNWTRIATPVQYLNTQIDTLVAFMSSSNVYNSQGIIAGSYLEIDNIQLIGASQPFPNGSFEGWTDVNSEEPDDWTTFNFFSLMSASPSTVTKSTDAHSGSYSAQVKTLNIDGDTIGFLTNGDFDEDGPFGGMHVDANPKKLTGYYKYTPVGPDTAVFALLSYRYDAQSGTTITLDSSFVALPPTAGFVQFTASLTYNTWPYADTVGIVFASSNLSGDGSFVGIGSELLVDDLSLEYYPVGVEENESAIKASVYPNPANDQFYIEYAANQGNIQFELYNLIGSKVMSRTINTSSASKEIISTNGLQKGIYLYTLVSGEDRMAGKIEIIK